MISYKNLTIIGTSHIAIESIREVQTTILNTKPEIIALELDQNRLNALMSNKKEKLRLAHIKALGVKGFLFNLIGAWIEKKLGQIVKVKPGSEMKIAAELAIQLKSKIALIDQDVRITLKKLSKSITLKEKFNFLADIFKAVILRKQEIKIDLRKVPSQKVIKTLLSKVKKRYPSVYRVLIKERNEIMAKNLYTLISTNKESKILAIVGAGHEEELINLIKKQEDK